MLRLYAWVDYLLVFYSEEYWLATMLCCPLSNSLLYVPPILFTLYIVKIIVS